MKTKIQCPNCKAAINVDDILMKQFRESVKKDLESELLRREKELREQLEKSRVAMKEQMHEEYFLKLKDREKVIEDLRLKLDEAKRQAEQGSMQLQGEVQELEVLEILKETHPTDNITQTRKGTNGGDILHVIRTETGKEAGALYYESKRTKSWSNGWIRKLKEDNLVAKADILVIVSSALPKDIKRYGLIDGIWVCTFNDVKELSLVLRYGLLKLQQVAVQQTGKPEKMELLYNYLCSEEFRSLFESILEGFRTMRESHHSEKMKMQRLWKEREKTLERVLTSSLDFYESLRTIAGSAIGEIKMLQEEGKRD